VALFKFLRKALSPGGHDTVAEASCFQSAQLTGTGTPQTIPHGLAAVPSKVRVYLVGSPPVTYVGCTIIEGIHNATNLYIQCTFGWVYQVEAYT